MNCETDSPMAQWQPNIFYYLLSAVEGFSHKFFFPKRFGLWWFYQIRTIEMQLRLNRVHLWSSKWFETNCVDCFSLWHTVAGGKHGIFEHHSSVEAGFEFWNRWNESNKTHHLATGRWKLEKKHQCRKCGIACYCMVLTTEYYALLFLQFHFICATPDDTGRYKRTLVRLGVIFGLQEDPG